MSHGAPSKSYLMKIYALTPLHPGSGREGIGYVDMPIQRDVFGYPCIYSSSLKGALKSFLYLRDEDLAKQFFGDEDKNEPGLYSVLDAYLIIFPARSLKGVVLGVTSPFLISRFIKLKNRILKNCSEKNTVSLDSLEIDFGKCIFIAGEGDSKDRYIVGDNEVVINELRLSLFDVEDGFKNILKNVMSEFLDGNRLVYKSIVVVNDDVLKALLRKSIIVYTRNRLEKATKTVKSGGLFTEEYLPQSTVLYSFLIRDENLRKDENNRRNPGDVLEGVLAVGGDESIGRGFVEIVLGC